MTYNVVDTPLGCVFDYMMLQYVWAVINFQVILPRQFHTSFPKIHLYVIYY